MRRVTDLEAWIAERRRVNTPLIAEAEAAGPVTRGRPRSIEEHAVLQQAALDSVARREAEGRLVRLGTRHYELRDR